MALDTSSEFSNCVQLNISENSKIAKVSVYPTRAHITRVIKFPAKIGNNHLAISGLLSSQFVEGDSERFEGNETTFIQDYTFPPTKSKLSEIAKRRKRRDEPQVSQSKTSKLMELEIAERRKRREIERTENKKKMVTSYFSTLNTSTVPPDKVGESIQKYSLMDFELDEDLIRLNSELEEIQKEVRMESIVPPLPATVSVFCELEGENEIVFHYSVYSAGWKPVYDIFIDSETKKVKLLYKAAVHQQSGEDWVNANLTLETSAPGFTGDLRPLSPWRLRVPNANTSGSEGHQSSLRREAFEADSGVSDEELESDEGIRYDSFSGSKPKKSAAAVRHNTKDPHSIATLEVKEPKSILGDGSVHKVTVAELELDGELRWVTIPKTGSAMYWNASIENKSTYPILEGSASVYVNKSLIAHTNIPYTSPNDRVTCSLGVDPTIQVIYHPREKTHSEKGVFSKSDSHIFEQRITIMNKKSCAVDNVKVIDQIPISEDSTISVNLISPALPMRAGGSGKSIDMSRTLTVSPGVVAGWDKGDKEEVHVDKLGADGKLAWLCSIPAHDKVTFVLSWEVTYPMGKSITGL